MKSLADIPPLRNTILEQLNLSKIHFAIMDGNYHYFTESLNNEDVIHILDKNRCSLLHYAVFYNNITMVLDLIRKGSLIDWRNEKGCTPLHFACGHGGNDQIALLLKRHGANPFIEDLYEDTPLIYALRNNNKKLFDDLCKV
jgi:ankyrin repeat protein